jgi:VWFA-related protein
LKPLVYPALIALLAQGLAPQTATFSITRTEVVVNVTVTDRNGKTIDNLTKDDFVLFEDGKPQKIEGFHLQRLENKQLPPVGLVTREAPPAVPEKPKPAAQPVAQPNVGRPESKFQDRRLIVMLFDFSAMQPADQIRAVDAALKFIRTQVTASDMISVMVFGNELKTIQDFTDDRDLLMSTIRNFHIGQGSELASMADTGADAEDQSGQFVADETEFNIFNTDRKLAALQDAARRLSQFPEKKALVYFSGGIEKTGVDNQSQLRATVNTAVRSNVAFYPIDARGLTASAPGGDASQAGAVGSNLYSGAGQRSLRDSFQNQQETLFTLASDTGGKAMLDSNDLTLGIKQVQADINNYYTLTYATTNDAQDGRYRRIQVKLAPKLAGLKAKLDYRQGYYGSATFAKLSGTDKEAQLQQAIQSDNPVTDLAIAVEIDYFRLAKGKYFVPVSVRIPGYALSFRNKGSKAATELEFIAQARDARGQIASVVRDVIPLKVDQTTAGKVTQKNVQYDTGLTLGPGKYTLRVVARENGEGKTGTFEAPFTVPDLGSGSALRLSSLVLSNQRQALSQQLAGVKGDKKLTSENPLIDVAGQKIVPNVTRVFRPDQDLYVYFEVYDPSIPENLPQNLRVASVAASVALYQGDQKVMETQPVRGNRLNAKRESALSLLLQTPLKELKPGQYTCQVNVIDELGKKFAFPRRPLVVFEAGK